MSECTSKPITKKTYFIQVSSIFIGILLASVIEKQLEQPIIGWFLGGLIIATGTLFAYKEKGERFTLFNSLIILLTGCVASCAYYLFSL